MNKIVIACDSFKGCLTSMEVANACERGIRRVTDDLDIVKVPVADGGEGTVEALVEALDGKWVSCVVSDPLMRPIETRYGVSADGLTAVMEMASASGLPLLRHDERNPMLTTTYGTGLMIRHAIDNGCRRILMGIGGSATNDAGMGMLQALGVRFFDSDGRELGYGGEMLGKINSFDTSTLQNLIRGVEFVVACDVTNPLYGPQGAARVYAPQKGADEEMVKLLDDGLRNFAAVMERSGLPPVSDCPGAGAAGGLGAALLSFLGAELRPGIDLVLDAVDFNKKLAGASLVITGEGRLDRQTAMGKAPYGVLQRAARHGIPVVAIGGAVEDSDALNRAGFLATMCIQQKAIGLTEAMKPETAAENISATASQITRLIFRS